MTEARLTPGRGFKPINSVLYYGMRLLPYAWSRETIACVLGHCINWLHRADEDCDIDRESDEPLLAELRRMGSSYLEALLSQAQIAEILAFLENRSVVANGRVFHLDEVHNDVTLASYSFSDVVSCPHLFSLINDARILRMARAYLGCRPTISSIYLQWSFPSKREAADVQCFHRDPDDWRFLKLFIYLTDVNDGSGPHEFVLGSHRSSGRIFSKPYGEEEVIRRYGRDQIRRIMGARGTTFIEDTWGIHRGLTPVAEPRLILQVQYSILPIMKLAYQPATIPTAEYFDRYPNRLLFQ